MQMSVRRYDTRSRSTEERRRKKNDFFTSRGAFVKLRYIAWKSAVEHVGGV